MSRKQKKNTNYDYFIRLDTTPYKGEWIAISGKKVISHGKDAKKVYQQAQKKTKKKDISLAKVPDEQILILKPPSTTTIISASRTCFLRFTGLG